MLGPRLRVGGAGASGPATVNKTLWPARTPWMPPVATARYGPVIQDTSNGGAAATIATIARCNKQQG